MAMLAPKNSQNNFFCFFHVPKFKSRNGFNSRAPRINVNVTEKFIYLISEGWILCRYVFRSLQGDPPDKHSVHSPQHLNLSFWNLCVLFFLRDTIPVALRPSQVIN
jgi:hypothetical protein